MSSQFDDYLRHRKYKPHWFPGFGEYESFDEYKQGVMKRVSRPFRRSYKRRRLTFRRPIPLTFLRKRRGFVKKYKRAAFAGRKYWNPAKLAKCIESKVTFFENASASLTHGAGGDFQFIAIPTVQMVQGTGFHNFSGDCIHLTGIAFECFFGPAATDNDSYHIRLCIFRCRSQIPAANGSGSMWIETGIAGGPTSAQTDQNIRFFDVDYSANSAKLNLVSRVNPNGPKLLYDKRIVIPNTNTAAGTNVIKFSHFLPLNQTHKFLDDPRTDTGATLTTAPNYSKYGDIFYVITFDNGSHIQGGTAKNLVISQSQFRIYFKDP